MIRLRKAKIDGRYINFNEFNRINRITYDLVKFVPFSLFIIIPGGEVLIPPYLYLFPNAIPTQFKNKSVVDKTVSIEMAN